MKIVLTTTFLVAVLAIGLSGINNNAFAQGNDTGMMGNDTDITMNATLPITTISNATLAFAQDNDTMSIGESNDTSMTMNATLPTTIIGDNSNLN